MKGYRTILLAVLSFVAYAAAWPDLTHYVSGQHLAMVTSAVALVMRFLTDTKVGTKE